MLLFYISKYLVTIHHPVLCFYFNFLVNPSQENFLMVIKNETLPCHNSETPASAPPSSTPDQLEEENDVSREDLNVDHDHDKLADADEMC